MSTWPSKVWNKASSMPVSPPVLGALIGRGAVAAARLRGRQLSRHADNPRPVQERALRHLVQRMGQTAFGRAHGLDSVDSPEAFRQALPLFKYADLKPWFERALDGEPDVVWPGRIQYFGMSSGTTAGNKYLPISHDSVRQQQRGGFDPVASYLRWTGDTGLLDGKAIMLGGSSRLEPQPNGILVGDNTGVMASHMPRLVQRNYLPSVEVRAIDDWEAKLDAIVEESLDADVRLIAGTPSWFPGLFDRLLEAARARGRAAGHIHDVWPNLRLMTGGGVNFEPYRRLIRARLGRHVPYVDVYNATEGGIMGVQDRPDERPMQLLPDNGLYYEFVPVEDLDADNPRRFSLWEVETGVVYALAVTTMSGIASYLIGDCVRFVECFPHRFLFEGRTAAFLNVTGEHISQGELEQAARHASEMLATGLRDFTVAAEVDVGAHSGTRHLWMVEFDGPVPDLEGFAQLVDGRLQDNNGDYSAHRGSQSGLLRPAVIALRAGAFDSWMKQRGKLGGQHKVPRVLNDAGHVASLQALSDPALAQASFRA